MKFPIKAEPKGEWKQRGFQGKWSLKAFETEILIVGVNTHSWLRACYVLGAEDYATYYLASSQRPPFTEKETEAQGGEAACPRAHCLQGVGLGLKPVCISPKLPNHCLSLPLFRSGIWESLQSEVSEADRDSVAGFSRFYWVLAWFMQGYFKLAGEGELFFLISCFPVLVHKVNGLPKA